MPGINLGGYDLALQITEAEINTQLSDPTVLVIPSIDIGFITLNPTFLSLELLQAAAAPLKINPVRIFISDPFTGPIGVIVELIRVPAVLIPGDDADFVISFNNVGPNDIDLSHPDFAFSPTPQMQSDIADELVSISPISITGDEGITTSNSADPEAIRSVDIAICADPTGPIPSTERCVTILAAMGGNTVASTAGFPAVSHGNGNPAALVVSDGYLLNDLIRPFIATEMGWPMNAPCDLSGTRSLYRESFGVRWFSVTLFADLTQFRVRVRQGYLEVTMAMNGGVANTFGINGSFTARLYPVVVDDVLRFNMQITNSDVNIWAAWWVYLISIFTVGFFGTLLIALAQIIFNSVIDIVLLIALNNLVRLVSWADPDIANVTVLPTLPLGQGGELDLDAVIIDDLVMMGKVIPDTKPPLATGPFAKVNGYWLYDDTTVLSSNINTTALTITHELAHHYNGRLKIVHSGFVHPVSTQWHIMQPGENPLALPLQVGSVNQWFTHTFQSGSGFDYSNTGSDLKIRNHSGQVMQAVFRAVVSDASGNTKWVNKGVFAKGPTTHICSFLEDILPKNPTGGDILSTSVSSAALSAAHIIAGGVTIEPGGASIDDPISATSIDKQLNIEKFIKLV